MAEYINIEPRETVERRVRMEAKPAAAYTVATGSSETVKYTGLWDDLQAMALVFLTEGGKETQVTCELERLEGGIAELTVTRERFEKQAPTTGDEGGGESEEPGNEVGTEDKPSYSSSGTLIPVSILCHPQFADLPEVELRALKAMLDGQDEYSVLSTEEDGPTGGRRIKDIIITDSGKMAMKYIRRGVREWVETHVQMTARWRGNTNRYRLREILSSVPGGISTPADCNWRVDGVGVDKQGDTVWQTATFTLSSPGGWDDFLYNV